MGLFDGLFGGGGAAVNVGDAAPEFDLSDSSGKRVRLSDFRGKKSVVLYFYPKDDTPGCTKEACGVRDRWAEFQKAGLAVYGVSADDATSHQKFIAKYDLPHTLLTADEAAALDRLIARWVQDTPPVPVMIRLGAASPLASRGKTRISFKLVAT